MWEARFFFKFSVKSFTGTTVWLGENHPMHDARWRCIKIACWSMDFPCLSVRALFISSEPKYSKVKMCFITLALFPIAAMSLLHPAIQYGQDNGRLQFQFRSLINLPWHQISVLPWLTCENGSQPCDLPVKLASLEFDSPFLWVG